MGIAVFQNRIQEALRFTGAGAGRHQRGYGVRAAQAVEGTILVHIRRIGRMQRLEPLVPVLSHAEWQLDRNIRFMEKVVFPLYEALDASTENRRRDGIRRIHIFNQAVPETGCEN